MADDLVFVGLVLVFFNKKVFQDYKEPLFWIHLNMDYPFNLKGILYFPKINMEYESIEGCFVHKGAVSFKSSGRLMIL